MDELHTLALDVARQAVESADEDPAIVALARLLLEEAAKAPARPPFALRPPEDSAGSA